MARAIRAVTVERGRDPRDLTLVAIGGNGAIHAPDVARDLGIGRVWCRRSPACSPRSACWPPTSSRSRSTTVTRRLDAADYSRAGDGSAPSSPPRSSAASPPTASTARACTRPGRPTCATRARRASSTGAASTRGDLSPRWPARFVAEYLKTYGYQRRDRHRARQAAPDRPRPARASVSTSRSMQIDGPAGSRRARSRAVSLRPRRRRHRPRRWSPRSAVSATPRRGPLIIEEFDATIVVPPDATVSPRRHRQPSSWSLGGCGR